MFLFKETVWEGAMSWRRIMPDDNLRRRQLEIARLSSVSVPKYTSAIVVDLLSMKSTQMTPFSSQKTLAQCLLKNLTAVSVCFGIRVTRPQACGKTNNLHLVDSGSKALLYYELLSANLLNRAAIFFAVFVSLIIFHT